MTSSGLQTEVAHWPEMTRLAQRKYSSSPLPERTDFGPRSLQLDRPTRAPASRTGLHPAMFSGNDSLVLVASVTGY